MASHPKFSLRQQANVRDEIDAKRLVRFLQDHAVEGSEDKIPVSRVRAAEVLLRKCLPDLTNVTVSGDDEKPPVRHEIVGMPGRAP